jgi:transcriptional regulator
LAAKGESQTNQIIMLNAIGFTASEIANLLGTTPNTVSVTVYQQKTERKGTKSRKK